MWKAGQQDPVAILSQKCGVTVPAVAIERTPWGQHKDAEGMRLATCTDSGRVLPLQLFLLLWYQLSVQRLLRLQGRSDQIWLYTSLLAACVAVAQCVCEANVPHISLNDDDSGYRVVCCCKGRFSLPKSLSFHQAVLTRKHHCSQNAVVGYPNALS